MSPPILAIASLPAVQPPPIRPGHLPIVDYQLNAVLPGCAGNLLLGLMPNTRRGVGPEKEQR